MFWRNLIMLLLTSMRNKMKMPLITILLSTAGSHYFHSYELRTCGLGNYTRERNTIRKILNKLIF